MPRLPRYAAPGIPQHVIQRGNNRNALDETTINTIRHATQKGWTLGSKRFRREVAALVGRRTEALRAWQARGNGEHGA